ncbi:MAG TPA: hypothetical protein EYP65_04360 [Armatimonadetes bacterium]|nr:hypothetical protein [Armatimonadota bacterium]
MPRRADEMLLEEEREVLDRIAEFVVERGLGVPAILFLEMHRPLAGIGGHALLMASPFLGPIIGMPKVEALYRALTKPGGIDYLIGRIEELSGGREGSKG